MIDAAIDFAAQRWTIYSEDAALPANLHLRDRIAFFAAEFRDALGDRFTALAAAPAEILLLIIAKGVEQAGTHDRRHIERGLGIILPP